MSATDPYAARNPKPTASPDVMPELDYFLGRLRQLGATDDELAGVAASWEQLEPADPANPDAWTLERRTAMVSANDADLVAMIDAARQEWAEATTTEEEQAAAERAAKREALLVDARRAAEGSVAQVLAWVGDDPERAAAVLVVESGPDERKTLVRPLAELVAE